MNDRISPVFDHFFTFAPPSQQFCNPIHDESIFEKRTVPAEVEVKVSQIWSRALEEARGRWRQTVL